MRLRNHMKKIIYALGGSLAMLALSFSPVLAITDTTPPSLPTNLTATAVSASQINLTWTASTDDVAVAAYLVFRNGSPIGFVMTNAFNDIGLTAATAYTYTVRALDTSGNASAYSAAASATTLAASTDTTAPSAPTNLTATAISAGQINLSWTAATDNVGVASYLVFRNGSPVGYTNTTAFSDTGLTATTTYTYTLQALDTSGNNSAYSAAVTATTLAVSGDTIAPSVPTGLIASAISSSQINLIWTAATDNVGVTGYTVLRNGTPIGTATSTTFSDTGLTAATAYTYTVKAFDAAGNLSAESSPASATTLSSNSNNRGRHDDEDENEDENEDDNEHGNSAFGLSHQPESNHGQGNGYGLYKHNDD